MILSDVDILAFLKSGDIVIDPFDPSAVKPGTYRFTLNDVLLRPKIVAELDATTGEPAYDTIQIPTEGFVIRPGDFFLGQTKETLSISTKLACVLDARSSLARIGLNVLQSSLFVEPGQQKSHETIEISNIGPSPVRVYAGMQIVRGYFVLLNTPAEKGYMGKYHGQSDMKAVLT